MDNLTNIIGLQIRILRKNKNLSQEELAFKANLHPTYIGQVERGEKNLTVSSLNMITKALDITLEEFFSFVEPSKGKDSIDFESNGTLPYQNIIKLLQEINASEQKKMLEIIKQLIEWKKL
ncbi:TPA: helix-turn-helix transcriptional regulator [Bacillus cereus]|uniref:helix-turn-helix domain-containing protein n=1 Tax=Bacillus cereus group TaxID=86661 RepID=UPI000A302AA8|nr:helix-turn-helix domain-containing protein [Bacillus cereus]HDX9574503.1 helix-turn-helix transcriptional regulator [Bacillus mobilis]MBL3739062.1 helix-turn-helix transcriptional regulator [Bacillus cereus]MBL3861864.1 helix-turn-helix transcriptional regulator [Bacillus cereus]MDG1600482.1 helix-turn-helix domain-containing protein [Bacillus cereus]SMD84904.1 anaerobic benzoate catabolism transcriptional regulator [Bacillus cereus]